MAGLVALVPAVRLGTVVERPEQPGLDQRPVQRPAQVADRDVGAVLGGERQLDLRRVGPEVADGPVDRHVGVGGLELRAQLAEDLQTLPALRRPHLQRGVWQLRDVGADRLGGVDRVRAGVASGGVARCGDLPAEHDATDGGDQAAEELGAADVEGQDDVGHGPHPGIPSDTDVQPDATALDVPGQEVGIRRVGLTWR
jgi:hypothetical protein